MEDEDIGSRLPLAICLEDSIFSVNIHRIMLSELTTRNDRSVYCAYNPVSKTLPENYTSLRSKEKKRKEKQKKRKRTEENRIRVQEKTGQWPIPCSTITAVTSLVYVKYFTLSHLFCPHNSSRGWYS